MFISLSLLGGLLSAISWGTGDFFGGLTSKRSGPLLVVITTGWIATIFLLGMALLSGEAFPDARSVALAMAAGVSGALGALFLYMGLASGTMGIVAPITGVVGTIVPIAVATLTIGAPSLPQVVGFVLALAAVWLLAGGSTYGINLRSVAVPVLAGLGFGFYFVLMAHAGEGGFYWLLVMQRIAAVLALLLWALLTRQSALPPRSLLPAAVAIALFDTGGNAFYLVATQAGRLDTAAVLSSLYPAVTVFLAWVILKEHLTRPQWAGVAAALAAIPLIVA